MSDSHAEPNDILHSLVRRVHGNHGSGGALRQVHGPEALRRGLEEVHALGVEELQPGQWQHTLLLVVTPVHHSQRHMQGRGAGGTPPVERDGLRFVLPAEASSDLARCRLGNLDYSGRIRREIKTLSLVNPRAAYQHLRHIAVVQTLAGR